MKQAHPRIWYVEDDADLAQATAALLREHDFEVRTLADAASARTALAQSSPDILMLDWNLPDADGITLCRKARGANPGLPILMITVRDDPRDIIEGLEAGADDYVTKPFDAGVLVSRIRALLRRSAPSHAILSCGDLRIDTDAARAYLDENSLDLTPTEYRLLQLFLENKGRILTRGQLMQRLWDTEEDAVYDNTLTVTVKRLRAKLGPFNCIKTVRSFGYRMEEPL